VAIKKKKNQKIRNQKMPIYLDEIIKSKVVKYCKKRFLITAVILFLHVNLIKRNHNKASYLIKVFYKSAYVFV